MGTGGTGHRSSRVSIQDIINSIGYKTQIPPPPPWKTPPFKLPSNECFPSVMCCSYFVLRDIAVASFSDPGFPPGVPLPARLPQTPRGKVPLYLAPLLGSLVSGQAPALWPSPCPGEAAKRPHLDSEQRGFLDHSTRCSRVLEELPRTEPPLKSL